ncbi:5-methylcytosine rRNA methyltransferase NSUN4 isoform X2 [Coffea eugenioides]|uniref:5-methylcytosine rRNA methyltransferase NSUN4 isoform X2 n=1 Tax=Coffea eugenioides TaxID=49369 RepID=UPI000F60FC31|nr:5-methylcytosine rRNA methyltransferase NSUN4 isoform X2 [Coffea eugenioides]
MEGQASGPDDKILPLPDEFIEFLNENGLDPSIYVANDSTPRYIRLKPGFEAHIEEFESEINCKLERLSWLPNFYCLPPDIRIASSKAYQEGKIYGIDAASGAAVSALDITSGDHVLDLCAAPVEPTESMLEGKSEIYKEWTSRRPWKERKKASKARENGAYKLFSQTHDPELIYYGRDSGVVGLSKNKVYEHLNDYKVSKYGYDKVLVDAECTHDGSIRHIQKFEQWGWETLHRRVLDAERTDELTALQLQLLSNGFRLLKVGGSLVYSTCSLTVSQNEGVVEKFLSQNKSAGLLEIDSARTWPCKSGQIPKTLRFDPNTSCTSGLFVAKFTKWEI